MSVMDSALEASQLSAEFKTHFDAIIIGSGAGGATTAEKLSAAGLSVLILEEGPYRTSNSFNMLEKEAYPDLYQDVAARKTKSQGITILQGRSVGGSTTVNWTSSFRTPEQVLQHWQDEYRLGELTKDELGPWFAEAEQALSIQPWIVPPNENNDLLRRGCNELDISSAVIPRNVRGCANLGYCGLGCPINAKQSMLVTTIPAALEQGATLISRARVTQLIHRNNRVSGVEIVAMNNFGKAIPAKRFTFQCQYVFLAAGSIGTPGVLLRSEIPDPHGRIGKRTFLHPTVGSAAIMPEAVNAHSGAPQSIYSDHFLWRDGVTGEPGYKLEVPPLHPMIASTIMPGHGPAHRTLMQQFNFTHVIIALVRDGFHPEDVGGEVTLDDNRREVLDYPITDRLLDATKDSLARMAEIQFAAGAKQVMPVHQQATLQSSYPAYLKALNELEFREHQLNIFSAHVMGGCAMSGDPKSGVTDSEGKVYEMDNLWVMDGSLMPTSLGVNPQLTIYAMIRRNCEKFVQQLG